MGPLRRSGAEATPYIAPNLEAMSEPTIEGEPGELKLTPGSVRGAPGNRGPYRVGSMEGCFGPALSSLPAFFLLSASSAPAVLSSLRSMTLIHLWSYALQERRFDALGASPYLWTEALRNFVTLYLFLQYPQGLLKRVFGQGQ